MAITNGKAFREWAIQIANVRGEQMAEIYGKLNRLENADAIVERAIKGKWSADKMLSALPAAVPPSAPVSPVFSAPVESSPAPEGFTPLSVTPVGASAADAAPQVVGKRDTRADRRRRARAGQGEQSQGQSIWKRWFPGKKEETADGSAVAAEAAKPATKNKMILPIVGGLLLLVVVVVVAVMAGGGSGGYDFSSGGGSQFDPTQPSNVPLSEPDPAMLEQAPVAPNENPLNFKGSIMTRGFLGKVQFLILVAAIGMLAALIGDIVYRKQWWDGFAALGLALFSIVALFPPSTVWWVGALFFLLTIGFIWFASFQGGRDYSPLVAYTSLVGVVGGLVFTRIAAIQNIFPKMLVASVPPMVDLGYTLQIMDFASLAFPAVVYTFIIISVALAFYESIRPSEDKSSRWGSLISAGVGLGCYFLFLHAVSLAPWVAYLIAFLISAGGSAALRSEPAKQWVTPVYGVRSPFDGAMLLTAVLILLLVMFGQAPWLVA